MNVKKVYRSLHTLSLVVAVKVDDREHFCEFTGGMTHPRRLNGSFATANPKLQKAMEAHPMHEKDFKLSKVVNLEPVKEPEKEEPEKEATKEGFVSEAANGQQAKEELNKQFGIPWSRLKNLEQVKKEADEIGISYPNWMT